MNGDKLDKELQEIAGSDQGQASVIGLAHSVAAFYSTLRENNLGKAEALQLTLAFIAAAGGAAHRA
jgi:hypothetical protein